MINKVLPKWLEDRNITEPNPYPVFAACIIEELLEPLYPKALVKEYTQKIIRDYFEDDVDMSDDLIDNASGEFTYTLKALTGSYAYYGKVEITISSSGIPENARRLENDTPRLLENGEFRSMD